MRRINRWYYKGGRPNALAKVLNTTGAWMYKLPFTPKLVDTLELVGRKSGEPVTMPVVIVHMDGERYIVSMLGNNTNWVKNLAAADGRAALLKGGRSEVRLVDVPVEDRAPILKRYCEIAPGGRAHFSIDQSAPIEEFEKIAADFPVYRVVKYR